MTQAASSNTTQAADAILALINSKPRSPRRDEIVAALAGLTAVNDNAPWQPTMLVAEMQAVLPRLAEATWFDCSLVPGSPHAALVEDEAGVWYDALDDGMLEAAETSNLVDLAVAYRISADSDTPDTIVDGCLARGEEAPDLNELSHRMELMGRSAFLAHRLATAVLAKAGIPEDACSLNALWRARGWMEARPTEEDWAEYIARLEREAEQQDPGGQWVSAA